MVSNTGMSIASLLSPSKNNEEDTDPFTRTNLAASTNHDDQQETNGATETLTSNSNDDPILIDTDDEDRNNRKKKDEDNTNDIIIIDDDESGNSTQTTTANTTIKSPADTDSPTNEDSTDKPVEQKAKRKYTRRKPADKPTESSTDKSAEKQSKPLKARGRAKKTQSEDGPSVETSTVDTASIKKSSMPSTDKPKETNSSSTPQFRTSINIMNLINQDTPEESNSTNNTTNNSNRGEELSPSTTDDSSNGATDQPTSNPTDGEADKSEATPENKKSKSTKPKSATSTPRGEFTKDGRPRQKPGPKPGYMKKKNLENKTPEATGDDSKEADTKNSDGEKSDTKKSEKKKDEKKKEEKQVKDDKETVKKTKDEKAKVKKDGGPSKPKKDTKKPASAAATPSPKLSYEQQQNQSLIKPNPQSQIPPPVIVEVTKSSISTSETVADKNQEPTKDTASPAQPSDPTKAKRLPSTGGTGSSLLDPALEPPGKPEEPIIALHVPLSTSLEKAGSKQVIFNVMKMSEDKYGFNKIHPHSSKLQDLLNMDDEIEMMDDDDDMEEEEELMEPEPKIDGRRSQKGKPKIGQYDYNDPFIDDTETLWEEQRASTKDGFFVFYGPLVEDGKDIRIEKSDGKVKRNRKRVANTTITGTQVKKQNSGKLLAPRPSGSSSGSLPAIAPRPKNTLINIAPVPSSKPGSPAPSSAHSNGK